jgi:Tfp pilus assembly major pilin PilA
MGKLRKTAVGSTTDPLVQRAQKSLKIAQTKATLATTPAAKQQAQKKLSLAKAGLARARRQAQTRTAAGQYWSNVKVQRQKILNKYKNCTTAQCAARDKELRKVTRLPATKGTWQTPSGNPAPAGQGLWVPSPTSRLAKIVKAHGKKGVPFSDGKPDFTLFPPKGMATVPQVDIEMSGNSGSDITAAENALIASGGPNTKGSKQPGTWHHETNGVDMSYVDKDVHTAYKLPDGSANPGTPHSGGDSMTRDPVF